MRALVKPTAGPGLELMERPEPAVGHDGVKIRVQRAGLCGTDLHLEQWDDWAASVVEPFTEAIRFLQFRFWNGAAWTESWSNVTPPPGIEVSLGFEPLPPEATPDKYPFEVFRRVIHLPCGVPVPAAETNLVARSRQP